MDIYKSASDLAFIHAPNYTNGIVGWASDTELKWLHLTAQKMESIVEIGSWKGKSTDALLSGCGGTVWAVDHFKGNEEVRNTICHEAAEKDVGKIFLSNVGHYKNLKLLKMDSMEAAKRFEDNSVDMVFIDGGHLYDEVKNDIQVWLPKTRRLLCGHDYRIRSGVKKAVDELLDIIYVVPSIWIKLI